jgi:hypothetical protein
MPLWALYAGGALLLSVVGFGAGWPVRTWKADSDELAQYEAGVERGKEKQQIVHLQAELHEQESTDAAADSIARQTEIRTIYRTERIEVPAECEPPADVLRVLDDAVGAANARVGGEPGGGLPAAPAPAAPVR